MAITESGLMFTDFDVVFYVPGFLGEDSCSKSSDYVITVVIPSDVVILAVES